MTGTHWVEESGLLEGPIMLTNTHSVGIVRDAVIEWQISNTKIAQPWALPVVAETFDGYLNDINGFHVRKQHVFEAIDKAASGPVAEGNTGGGTGMISCSSAGSGGRFGISMPGGIFIGGTLMSGDLGGALGGQGGSHREAAVRQDRRRAFGHVPVVVDDEDTRAHGRFGSGGPARGFRIVFQAPLRRWSGRP